MVVKNSAPLARLHAYLLDEPTLTLVGLEGQHVVIVMACEDFAVWEVGCTLLQRELLDGQLPELN